MPVPFGLSDSSGCFVQNFGISGHSVAIFGLGKQGSIRFTFGYLLASLQQV